MLAETRTASATATALNVLNVLKLKTERTSAHTFGWNSLSSSSTSADGCPSKSITFLCLLFAEDKLFIDWNLRQWISEKRYFRSSAAPPLTPSRPHAHSISLKHADEWFHFRTRQLTVKVFLLLLCSQLAKGVCIARMEGMSECEQWRWKFEMEVVGMCLIADCIVCHCGDPAAAAATAAHLWAKVDN